LEICKILGFSFSAAKSLSFKLTVIISDKTLKHKTEENNSVVSLAQNWVKNEKKQKNNSD